ncbi:Alpha/Beta hydrolase protein [Trichoderma austrokoningii]
MADLRLTAVSIKPRLSIGDKIKLIGIALFACPYSFAIALARLLLYAFQNELDLRYYAVCAVFQTVFSTLGGLYAQTIFPSTEEAYRAWIGRKERLAKDPALKERLQCDIQPLDDGHSSILWVGNRHKARKIVLYLHGGGFQLPSIAGHFECVWNSYVLSGVESETEVAVAFLQYSLAPTWRAPVQLRQAAAALSEILAAGFSAKDIIFGGDSAGGNLTVQLLHHLIDPHAEVARIVLQEPLSAAFLVSPWLGKDTSAASFREHNRHDMVSVDILHSLVNDIRPHRKGTGMNGISQDGWAEPFEWKGPWLGHLGSVIGKLYITIGDREILADHGKLMAKTVAAMQTGVEVTLESNPRAAHDFLVVEGLFGEIGEETIKMKQWFKAAL